MSETLLRYVAARHGHAQAASDELRQRALELILAACVTEWGHTPKTRSPSTAEPLPEWSEDEVPKVDYGHLAGRLDQDDTTEDESPTTPDEPEPAPERTEERVWWAAAEPEPEPPPAEPTRGAWQPPPRS